MKFIIALSALLFGIASAAIDCNIPKNCGINQQYSWSVEQCACVKTCFPKTQEDCGDPSAYELNLETCQCDCVRQDCGSNPMYQWSTEECRCVLIPY